MSSFINLRNVMCVMLILLTGSSRKDKRAHEVSSRACARLQQGEESCISCASLALLLSGMPVFFFFFVSTCFHDNDVVDVNC